jgi:hypothetical protein
VVADHQALYQAGWAFRRSQDPNPAMGPSFPCHDNRHDNQV